MVEIQAGMLLLASPELLDPNFIDTVVLLLDADDDGAMGVVLNRPSPVPVVAVLADWSEVVAEPEVLFRGGPVSPEGALAVALLRQDDVPTGSGRSPTGWRSSTSRVRPTRSTAGRRGADLRRVRRLGRRSAQGEIAGGDWYVVPSLPTDAFQADPTELWREVMRRQPGALAWHVNRPAGP